MKKKFTMLFAALLACVGVSAQTVITDVSQLSNDKVYSIVPKDATRGAMYATSTSQNLDACGGTKKNAANPSISIDANSADQQFALYTHEGSMYLFSVGAGKFVSEVSANNLFPLVEKPGNAVAVEASGEEGYFIIKAKKTEFINVSTGWSAGCVAGWNQIDDGNKLQITEVSAMPAATLAQLTEIFSISTRFTALLETAEETYNSAVGNVGTAVGTYPEASVSALNTAIATAKNVSEPDESNLATLQAAVDGLAINLPEVGKFYAIKSASTNAYCKDKYVHSVPSPITRVDATWGSNAYDHRHLVFDEMVSIDATALWQFTEDMKMRNVHTGEYVKSFNKNSEHMGAEATASSITIKPLGSSQVSLQIGSNRPMHAQQAYFVIVDWNAELNNASAWYIEEVTEFAHPLTIDEYDYMTLTLGFNAEVPEGVTAYKVTGAEGKELVLESVGTVIPAGEPVIVYAEVAEGQTKDVEFAYTAEEATKSGDNLLKGNLYESNVAPTEGYDAYVMALNGSEVVMGKAMLNVNENTQFKNRANKAYLELQQEVAAGAAMFSFGRGEGTTSIDNVQLTNDNVVIYDLTGRRVEKMEKGIYIVNGKKVIR